MLISTLYSVFFCRIAKQKVEVKLKKREKVWRWCPTQQDRATWPQNCSGDEFAHLTVTIFAEPLAPNYPWLSREGSPKVNLAVLDLRFAWLLHDNNWVYHYSGASSMDSKGPSSYTLYSETALTPWIRIMANNISTSLWLCENLEGLSTW